LVSSDAPSRVDAAPSLAASVKPPVASQPAASAAVVSSPVTAVTPQLVASTSSTMMCPHCKAPQGAQAKYCNECGKNMRGERQESSRARVLCVCGCLVRMVFLVYVCLEYADYVCMNSGYVVTHIIALCGHALVAAPAVKQHQQPTPVPAPVPARPQVTQQPQLVASSAASSSPATPVVSAARSRVAIPPMAPGACAFMRCCYCAPVLAALVRVCVCVCPRTCVHLFAFVRHGIVALCTSSWSHSPVCLIHVSSPAACVYLLIDSVACGARCCQRCCTE